MDHALHFVGFRGEEFWSAVRVWGQPDFFHRRWDRRAAQEMAPGDTVVFARGSGTHCPAGGTSRATRPSPFSVDDSNQPDDPAAAERLER